MKRNCREVLRYVCWMKYTQIVQSGKVIAMVGWATNRTIDCMISLKISGTSCLAWESGWHMWYWTYGCWDLRRLKAFPCRPIEYLDRIWSICNLVNLPSYEINLPDLFNMVPISKVEKYESGALFQYQWIAEEAIFETYFIILPRSRECRVEPDRGAMTICVDL